MARSAVHAGASNQHGTAHTARAAIVQRSDHRKRFDTQKGGSRALNRFSPAGRGKTGNSLQGRLWSSRQRPPVPSSRHKAGARSSQSGSSGRTSRSEVAVRRSPTAAQHKRNEPPQLPQGVVLPRERIDGSWSTACAFCEYSCNECLRPWEMSPQSFLFMLWASAVILESIRHRT